LRETPHGQFSQVGHACRNLIIRGEPDIVEGGDDPTEPLEADGSSLKSLSIAHLEAFHEHSAISVRVNFELHSDRPVITIFNALHWFISDHTFAVLHENRLVLGCFDSRTRVPGELVTKRVVSLLSNGESSAVAFVASDSAVVSMGFVDDFHSSHNINTGIKAAFVQEDKASLFDVLVHG